MPVRVPGAGSGGKRFRRVRFRKVPEGSGVCRFRRQVPEDSGGFWRVLDQVSEGSGVRCPKDRLSLKNTK